MFGAHGSPGRRGHTRAARDSYHSFCRPPPGAAAIADAGARPSEQVAARTVLASASGALRTEWQLETLVPGSLPFTLARDDGERAI